MNATAKASKSATVALLSTKVQSMRSFMELVMVDDEDTLKAIAELDDIDRMSASELREAVRELKGNYQSKTEMLADANEKITVLKRKGQKVAFLDGANIYSTLIEQIDKAKRQIQLSLSEIDLCISSALEVEGDEVDREGMNTAHIALARCIKDALDEPQGALLKVNKRFEDTIALLADEAAAA